MSHIAFITATNSDQFKVLSKIHKQFSEFVSYVETLDATEKTAFLKKLLIENSLIVPIKHNLPLVFIMQENVYYLHAFNHESVVVFSFIENTLLKSGMLRLYKYNYRGDKDMLVYIFFEDYKGISKQVKDRLTRIYAHPS